MVHEKPLCGDFYGKLAQIPEVVDGGLKRGCFEMQSMRTLACSCKLTTQM